MEAKGTAKGAVLGRFEFVVQQRSLYEPTHSVAKADALWSEVNHPYEPVGELVILTERVPEEQTPKFFSPWSMLNCHQPVGPMNEARWHAYASHRRARMVSLGIADGSYEGEDKEDKGDEGAPTCPVAGMSAEQASKQGIEMPHGYAGVPATAIVP